MLMRADVKLTDTNAGTEIQVFQCIAEPFVQRV